jgi:hypothetical protein
MPSPDDAGQPTLPPQANKPTEAEKKDHPTRYIAKGKILFGGVEEEVDIDTETTPNANGGYDTRVRLPRVPIAAVSNN